MSKVEKVLAVLAFAIIIVLAFITSSFATDYNAGSYTVGDTISINYSDYNGSNSLFCIEHGQKLKSGKVTYRVVSRIHLRGNTSTDVPAGNTQTSLYNGQLAYIISATAGGANQNRYDLTTIRQSIWHMISTWVNTVGIHHNGISAGIISGNSTAAKTALNTEAENYANNVSSAEATDNTNKGAIQVISESHDGVDYVKVGPFNWSYPGALTGTTVYDQNGAAISDIRYVTYNGATAVWSDNTSIISSGRDFYVAVPNNGTVTAITGIKGNFTKQVLTAELAFLQSTKADWQNLMIVTPGTETDNVEANFEYNIPMLGDLEIEKVNKDNHSVKLVGVGFVIQNKETGKYVHQDSSTGAITYVSREEATEFITDQNGKIHIENLVVGTYIAYETTLGNNYGYELIEGGTTIQLKADEVTIAVIENKQIYVKLSGFVWVDKQSSKQSYRNDYYATNTHPTIPDYEDDKDILLDGITVRLKDRTTGETIAEAVTSNGGAYLFEDVLIEKLQDYYIEFEYDGLTYTNVVPHIDVNNGSKSAENATERDNFNRNFSVVEGTDSESTGITRDSNGNQVHTLNYNINQAEHTSTLINNGQYPITANTNETGYSIYDNFEYGQEEIKYINLGLYEREQPDMALLKDVNNVKVAINGYNHVYQYAQRFVNQGEYGDGFNVGVKFANKYGSMAYTRAIYKADYEYISEDASRELKVYVTYQIRLRNESTNLVTQINSISDYYDSRFLIVNVGTVVNQNGDVEGDIRFDSSSYNNEYSKATIYTNTKLTAQSSTDIYVQFELNREAVLNILNNGENLDNITEINSYSVFDSDGTTVYAGIDKDSNPGNITPGSTATYQDDTDHAPSLKLEVADARVMTGTVFVDDTGSLELQTGQERKGNGAFDDGEATVPNVEVTLTENSGTGLVYTAVTNNEGNFTITDYIPGDYTVTFTWGDETYTVQDYKGTIYDSNRDRKNTSWYKVDADTRLTDALDDYSIRQQIDEELKNKNANTGAPTITKMDSTTPTMAIGVEYDTTYTASSGDRYEYRIYNVDFGIALRPKQAIGLNKNVKAIRLTLANGQILVDATIENGVVTGQTSGLTYMPPSSTTQPSNGFVRIELDNELIQGATLQVTYEIKATNISELDYLNEDYYLFGKEDSKTNVVKITPKAVIDYLDNEWAFSSENNADWQVTQLADIQDRLVSIVYESELSTINDKTILYTESLSTPLEPTQDVSVDLNVSKILTTTDEISLDNETEIIEIDKDGGSDLESIPGNYVPGTGKTEYDDAMAETVIVTPSTGQNLAFVLPIVIGLVLLAILGGGVVFIKRKVLNPNNKKEE